MGDDGVLAPEEREALLPPLITASTAAFGTDTAEVWRERLEGSWFDRVDRLLLILDPHGELVGWTSYRRLRLAGARALYMDTTGIVPEHQRQASSPQASRGSCCGRSSQRR